MWTAVVALALHALATTALTRLAPVQLGAVWDMGHQLIRAAPGFGAVVECATFAIPVAVWKSTPTRERADVARRAIRTFAALLTLRSLCLTCTVLPFLLGGVRLNLTKLLLGHGLNDYIFSGHTALVASWLMAPYRPWRGAWLVALLHAVCLLAARLHYTIDIVLAWMLAGFLRRRPPPIRLSLVWDDMDVRREIYRARHEVYGRELCQYPCCPEEEFRDDTDAYNAYVVATRGDALQGFVAVTPPGFRKAMERHGVRPLHPDSYEIRLLTVVEGCRGQGIAGALIHGAARYIVASGGTALEGLARLEVLPVYTARGASVVSDEVVRVGGAEYVHIHVALDQWIPVPPREHILWDLPYPLHTPAPCTHGGKGLETLAVTGVNADVLDAWFPPAPAVARELAANLEADLRTTPPAACEQLLDALSAARQVDRRCFVVGAGSSDLIYRCFFAWLTPESRVLLLEPTYAEYRHVLTAIGCEVVSLPLDGECRVSPGLVPPGRFDLVVLVNPNSPTGIYSDRIMDIVDLFDTSTRVWVDETYIDFVGADKSLERVAAHVPNLVVCKSMSKAYGLSGVRVGYLCAHPMQLDLIRKRSPPWTVSRLAQRAAVLALQSPEYYAAQYAKTHELRAQLADWLQARGWKVVQGARANFVMCRPPQGFTPREVHDACALRGVFIRVIDEWTLRLAVKEPAALAQMMAALEAATAA